MDKSAELKLDGKTYELPIVEGTEKERAFDISHLRSQSGYITLDDGYANTGSCLSEITFIDGEKGILRYRGVPIEELAEKSSFIEVAHLIITGKLPNNAELRRFSDTLTQNELLHESMKHHFEGFPATAHPMATVRMVASSRANLFASAAAGVCALWGPLHGGANQAVLEMLDEIHRSGDDGSKFIAEAKNKGSGKRLMGFGHRVYKNYDPRAKIIKKSCDELLSKLQISDPLLDIAKNLEAAALRDDYFVERKLYPNVDFYSGIIMRAIGIPIEMFTVMFAIGRMPGWIANYREVMEAGNSRIYRPRQIYTGPTLNHYTALKDRK